LIARPYQSQLIARRFGPQIVKAVCLHQSVQLADFGSAVVKRTKSRAREVRKAAQRLRKITILS